MWLGIGQAALIAYLALLRRMQPYIQALDEARLNLASLSASVNAVSELLSLRPWAADAVGGQTLAELKEGVRFEHVTFAYRGKDQEIRNAVEDISLTIPVGKTTAIVGLSGAGKSTLINLLFRFHDPFEGRITVDGVPLTKIDLSWWRRQLAIAGQDADLINGTIRENIAYGLPDISPDAILEAARKACADGFISELPKGYETRVGERGVLLSAGQRQRIGLARALVRDGGDPGAGRGDQCHRQHDRSRSDGVAGGAAWSNGRRHRAPAQHDADGRSDDRSGEWSGGRSWDALRTLLTGRAVLENGQAAGAHPYRRGNRLQLRRPDGQVSILPEARR